MYWSLQTHSLTVQAEATDLLFTLLVITQHRDMTNVCVCVCALSHCF